MIRLQKQSSSESLSVHPHKQSWEDFVDDLWKNNLSNFRHGNYSYAVIMTADQKKRVYSLRNIDRSDEELLNDLMTAGVSESELLPDTDADEETSSNSDSPFMSTKASHVPPPLLPRQEPLMEPIDSFATAMSYPKSKLFALEYVTLHIEWLLVDLHNYEAKLILYIYIYINNWSSSISNLVKLKSYTKYH